MNTIPLTIKVIAGSTREGRFSDKAAAWIVNLLNSYNEVHASVIDLRDFDMPFFNSGESPAHKSKPYENEAVARFTKEINEADGFVIVTPEYNHSTSGVLKNALDWVYQEWNNKPVAFVSYGSVGGARAIEHLRLIAVELQMASVREAVHIAADDFFPVTMGGASTEEMFKKYEKKAEVMIKQLLPWTKAFKTLRN